jgi:hypothetical protein
VPASLFFHAFPWFSLLFFCFSYCKWTQYKKHHIMHKPQNRPKSTPNKTPNKPKTLKQV